MTPTTARNWKPENILLYAHTASLCLGICLVFWALVPVMVDRILSREAPSTNVMLAGGFLMLIGVTLVASSMLIRWRLRTGIWVAFVLSALLAAVGVVIMTMSEMRLSNTFLCLLSAATCFACWLALDAHAHLTDRRAAAIRG